ncbi:MAG TPA: 1-(5-phosphoribosyl)-5-[(5-phosphoribosylamino)methylideneamino]imidazole-4-carboxamide isomerase [Gemmataceae bacterium]
MRIYPAIDIRAGRCVRLRQGDYARETVFADDPAAVARRWVDLGAEVLHLVDLDGAKEGRPVNGESVREIVRAAGVPCQLGGGMRDESHVAEAFAWGVERVILGTRALRDPGWLGRLAGQYPGRVVLGIDARDGKVATDGWLSVSEVPALELARRCEPFPLAGIVYTDISRDGMLQGPNLTATEELSRAVRLPVIASGGVTTADHVRQLKERGLAGCIIGRALYEGTLDLREALQIAREGGRGA